jgi:hypothetical protein
MLGTRPLPLVLVALMALVFLAIEASKAATILDEFLQ